MKNAILRLSALLTAVLLLAGIPLAYAADGYDYAYTYTYDFWSDMRYSPDAYRVKSFLTSASLGLETELTRPEGLFVSGEDVYICDTGNNRILQLRCANGEYTVVQIISGFNGEITDTAIYTVNKTPTLLRVKDVEDGSVTVAADAPVVPGNTFNGPKDVYVTADGTLFIADTGNNRIVKLDKDLNYMQSFVQPVDPTYDQNKSFQPVKLVADVSGRVFCLATNINMGLMKYESDATFTGFIGAAPVKYTWYELIWRLFSTKEQRAQQASSVTTEYKNIAIDQKGFFYVVTNIFDENELMSGSAEPIRRLNSLGSNILIENGTFPPVGDVQWAAGNLNIDQSGPSRFIDIAVLDNDIYVALDENHNRLFGYDKQGNMLWAFGGRGNALGYFNKPVAIESMGDDLLVLDSLDGSLTVMTPTEYGSLIYRATDEYNRGEYDQSAATWTEVLKQNGNYDLAYIGVGRAELQRGNYEAACNYFRMARDPDNYSEAFRYYRSDLVEKNIGWIFGVAAVVLILPAAIGKIKKIKWEVDNA
ncbi:MAG: hypothetical protein IJ343_01725 [Clostridia bacterium]|nr:hypothetical protein [Clostridia bacterium]